MLVVRAAEESHPLRIVLLRAGESILVIELDRAGLRAPVSALVDKRTPASIALIDRPLDRVRNVARHPLLFSLCRGRSRLPPHRKPLFGHLLDQHVERPLQHLRHAPIRDPVPQQVLGVLELVPECRASGEFDLEHLRRQRRHHSALLALLLHRARGS